MFGERLEVIVGSQKAFRAVTVLLPLLGVVTTGKPLAMASMTTPAEPSQVVGKKNMSNCDSQLTTWPRDSTRQLHVTFVGGYDGWLQLDLAHHHEAYLAWIETPSDLQEIRCPFAQNPLRR